MISRLPAGQNRRNRTLLYEGIVLLLLLVSFGFYLARGIGHGGGTQLAIVIFGVALFLVLAVHFTITLFKRS